MSTLAGRAVVVTRPAAQAAGFIADLEEAGAEVIACPTLEVVAPSDRGAALRSALAELDTYPWVILTSVNGVEWFLDVLGQVERLERTKLAAIGPTTADALIAAGVGVDLVPESAVAESLLEGLLAASAPTRALLPRAELARDTLPEGLARAGWQVTDVATYRTVTPELSAEQLLATHGADVITFTSPSTFERFCDAVGAESLPPVIASIGPITTDAIRAAGHEVAVEAEEHTVDGLVRALIAWGSTAEGH